MGAWAVVGWLLFAALAIANLHWWLDAPGRTRDAAAEVQLRTLGPDVRCAWLLHQGTPANDFYGFYARRPSVMFRKVRDLLTGAQTPQYQANAMLTNLCRTGTESLGIQLPLGGLARMFFVVVPVDQSEPSTGEIP